MRVLLCLASGALSQRAQYPIIGDNSIMDPKEHGTCPAKPTEVYHDCCYFKMIFITVSAKNQVIPFSSYWSDL